MNRVDTLLLAGWTLSKSYAEDKIRWRSPRGISGSDYVSESHRQIAAAVLEDASIHGDI